jgi:hypothetical protein
MFEHSGSSITNFGESGCVILLRIGLDSHMEFLDYLRVGFEVVYVVHYRVPLTLAAGFGIFFGAESVRQLLRGLQVVQAREQLLVARE